MEPPRRWAIALIKRRFKQAVIELDGVLGVSLPKLVMPYRALLGRAVSWDDALAYALAAEG